MTEELSPNTRRGSVPCHGVVVDRLRLASIIRDMNIALGQRAEGEVGGHARGADHVSREPAPSITTQKKSNRIMRRETSALDSLHPHDGGQQLARGDKKIVDAAIARGQRRRQGNGVNQIQPPRLREELGS